MKLIANILSRGTPLDSIRQIVVTQSAAWSPLPCTNRIGGMSAEPAEAGAVCAHAARPNDPASRGGPPPPPPRVRMIRPAGGAPRHPQGRSDAIGSFGNLPLFFSALAVL